MKRLIKRYVLKAQIDKESDEVNEGEPGCGLDAELREGWREGPGKSGLQEENMGSQQLSIAVRSQAIGCFCTVEGRCHSLDK